LHFYELNFGVRQGSVLSPFLFYIYLDEFFIIIAIACLALLCYMQMTLCCLTQSVSALQMLLSACERELLWLRNHAV